MAKSYINERIRKKEKQKKIIKDERQKRTMKKIKAKNKLRNRIQGQIKKAKKKYFEINSFNINEKVIGERSY